jgi:phage tail sheath protein FI
MTSVAEHRGDAVALLDTPQASQKSDDAIAYRQLHMGIDSSYAALYTSDNFVSDTYNGKKLYTPPSGWAAAVCARTDRLVGASGAPAGLNRGIIPVLGARYNYDDQERTNLFLAQVNYTFRYSDLGTGNSTIQEECSTMAECSAHD